MTKPKDDASKLTDQERTALIDATTGVDLNEFSPDKLAHLNKAIMNANLAELPKDVRADILKRLDEVTRDTRPEPEPITELSDDDRDHIESLMYDLDRISHRQAESIRLCHYYGLSQHHASAKLQISVEACGRELNAGYRSLVDLLTGGSFKLWVHNDEEEEGDAETGENTKVTG